MTNIMFSFISGKPKKIQTTPQYRVKEQGLFLSYYDKHYYINYAQNIFKSL